MEFCSDVTHMYHPEKIALWCWFIIPANQVITGYQKGEYFLSAGTKMSKQSLQAKQYFQTHKHLIF